MREGGMRARGRDDWKRQTLAPNFLQGVFQFLGQGDLRDPGLDFRLDPGKGIFRQADGPAEALDFFWVFLLAQTLHRSRGFHPFHLS